MIWRTLADLTLIIHLLFILFVIFGGLLILWRKWVAALQLPAVIWVVILEINRLICPLTPLENKFRQLAGDQGYSGGFIEHYLIPIIYPSGLSPGLQQLLAMGAITINLVIYSFVVYRFHGKYHEAKSNG